jgi:DNA-binding CsgD family transcriptional regulator
MQHFKKNKNLNDTLFQQSNISLLDDKQWSYIRKRYRMTARELQIAKLICKGLNNAEIAEILDIRHGTVKTHLRNIYRRVRVKSKILMLLRFIGDTRNFSAAHMTNTPPIPIRNLKQQTSTSPIPTEKSL